MKIPASLALIISLLHVSLLAAAERPNIVVFLVDDLGFADCGFNGGTDIRTPQIDALAAAGTILGAHYVQPVCSPTRAALMTGRYAVRTGVYTIVRPGARWGLPLAERTLATALKDAGYETAITGKWHLGEFERTFLPTSRGFDHQYGHYFGALDYFTHIRDGKPDWYRNDQPLQEAGYTTELLANEAVRLIRSRSGQPPKPLFLYVPFNGVHAPLQVPEKYLTPYQHLQGNRRTYAGMLAAVDAAIGQIVSALRDAGQLDNTLIVFSADNGGPNPDTLTRNTPFRAGKGTLYEGGIRSAAFACWPGRIPAGGRTEEPVHIIDWFPTFVEVAGGAPNQPLPLDGRSLLPMLTAGKPSPHESLLLVQSPVRAAVRAGDWKLLRLTGTTTDDGAGDAADNTSAAAKNAGQGKGKAKNKAKNQAKAGNAENALQLYNLRQDPGETKNLAAEEPGKVAELQTLLDNWLKDAVPSGVPRE
jgi:arylsulfatase A-like enzyme